MKLKILSIVFRTRGEQKGWPNIPIAWKERLPCILEMERCTERSMVSRKDTWRLCRLLLSSHLHPPSFSQPASSSEIYVLSFSLGWHPLWSFYLTLTVDVLLRLTLKSEVGMVDHHLVRNNAPAVSNTIRGVRLVEYYNPMSANATAFGKEMYEPPQWILESILSPYNYSRAVAQLNFPHILRLNESLPIKSDFNMQCLVPQDCSICSAQGGENDIRFYLCHWDSPYGCWICSCYHSFNKYNDLPQHLEPLSLILEMLAAYKATAPPYERPVKVRIKNLTPDVIFSEVIHRLDFAAGKHVCSSTLMKSELDVQVFYYYTSIS